MNGFKNRVFAQMVAFRARSVLLVFLYIYLPLPAFVTHINKPNNNNILVLSDFLCLLFWKHFNRWPNSKCYNLNNKNAFKSLLQNGLSKDMNSYTRTSSNCVIICKICLGILRLHQHMEGYIKTMILRQFNMLPHIVCKAYHY